MKKRQSSRLARKEDSRNLKQAVLFGTLTVVLAIALIFLGIPALIRMAIFLGNLRSSYTPVETRDTLSPGPPILTPLTEATNSAQINLQGFAESGATVEIFLNGSAEETIVVQTDGSFSVNHFSLGQGINEIYAQATDEAGNTSQASDKLTIIRDDQPPELEITEPIEGTVFSSHLQTISIKGQTEAGASLTINDRLVIIDSEGNFNYPLSLTDGENKIRVVAQDKAGNQTERELTIGRE